MSLFSRLPGISELRAFEATVRLGTISSAAKELYLTDGAISRAIKELEKEIGFPLFERKGRVIVPLPQSFILAKEIARSLEIVSFALEDTKKSFKARPWVLSCEPTFLIRWLIPRITSLQKALGRDDDIQLVSAGGPVQFSREGIDFAIRRNDFPTEGDIAMHPFMQERIGPVCRVKNPLSSTKDESVMKSLLHTASRPEAWETWERLTGDSLKHEQELKFEHFYQSLQGAVSGLGFAIGPIALVADDIAGRVLAAPWGFVEDGSQYVLMAPQGKDDHPIFSLILSWLQSQAKETETLLGIESTL